MVGQFGQFGPASAKPAASASLATQARKPASAAAAKARQAISAAYATATARKKSAAAPSVPPPLPGPGSAGPSFNNNARVRTGSARVPSGGSARVPSGGAAAGSGGEGGGASQSERMGGALPPDTRWTRNEVQLAQVEADGANDGDEPTIGCRIVGERAHIEAYKKALDAAQLATAVADDDDDDNGAEPDPTPPPPPQSSHSTVSSAGTPGGEGPQLLSVALKRRKGAAASKGTAVLYFDGRDYAAVMERIGRLRGLPPVQPLPEPLQDVLQLVDGKPPRKVEPADMARLVGPEVWDQLKPYQRTGVQFIASRHGRVILADGMGLGKTAQAIAGTMLYRKQWPVLVVAPATVRYNIRHEFMQWAKLPQDRVVVVKSTAHLRATLGRGPRPDPKATTAKTTRRRTATGQTQSKKRPRQQQQQQDDDDDGEGGGEGVPEKVALMADVYIVSYDLLPRPGVMAAVMQHGFKVLMADESHYIKHLTAARTACVLELAKAARHVILMSGTPGVTPMELYPQMLAVQPTLWPNWWKAPPRQIATHELLRKMNHKLPCTFAARWCDPRPQRVAGGRFEYVFNGSARVEELHSLGRHFCWIQRNKEEALRDLPPKHRECIRFALSEEQELQMQESLDAMRSVGDTSSIKRLALFSQIFNSLPAIKAPFLRKYVNGLFEGDGPMAKDHTRKCLLFAHHRAVIDDTVAQLKAKGIEHIVITGDTSAKARPALVQRFQTDPSCRVAVLSLTAAGVGINLFAASLVVMLEMLFGPDVLLQAEDRAHRLGQTRPVDVTYLICSGSIEEMIWRIVQRKQKCAVRMLQDRNGAFAADRTTHVQSTPIAPSTPSAPSAPTTTATIVTTRSNPTPAPTSTPTPATAAVVGTSTATASTSDTAVVVGTPTATASTAATAYEESKQGKGTGGAPSPKDGALLQAEVAPLRRKAEVSFTMPLARNDANPGGVAAAVPERSEGDELDKEELALLGALAAVSPSLVNPTLNISDEPSVNLSAE